MDAPDRFTFSREKHVQVDGKFADAVLGDFVKNQERFVVAIEGKGPKDPLDRPHGSRKMSAVDQGYRYAINLPCDWVIVTSMRQTRLYHKGSNQHTYESFDIGELASDEVVFKKFVFLLGAERVVPTTGRCHFLDLLAASEQVGRELTKEFYLRYAEMREQAFEQLRKANPSVSAADILRSTQKLLDRVLFSCFAEDRGLLPSQTVELAYKHNDPYNPRPVWENFRGLFRAINLGNDALHIPAYNGGLFADDPLLDGLKVTDNVCRYFQDLAAYDFRTGSRAAQTDEQCGGPLVDVEILGHIFEQSITDLEKLHDELSGRAEAVSAEDRVSRRKKEGAFYTQSFITRYIVSQALGGVLRDRFERLRLRHLQHVQGTAGKALENPIASDAASLNRPQRNALIRFWEEWQDELGRVRIVDPACGSGAFLLEAFDQLYAAYQLANDRLELLRGHRSLFDLDRHILQHNLFGVDLNHEAIEICRLSLWIKTAERGKVLTSLDGTVTAGNSVVADPAVDPRAFDWQQAFPHVFADGGFDVVVANPPYVRQEWIAPIKPYLQQHYKAYDSTADLYVYFYELALRLLKPDGRMSFIVTNKWLRSAYGEPLRRLLGTESWVESVVDFGHAKQIFPDADVFPCILTTRKPGNDPAPAHTRVCVIPRDQLRIEDLSRQIEDEGVSVPRTRLGEAAWNLEPPDETKLMEKIAKAGVPLKTFAGVGPLRGILTGFNEAFLLDTTTKEQLVKEDPASAPLFKPYLRGQDVDRWHAGHTGLWMLAMRSSANQTWPWSKAGDKAEAVFAETYPALYAHMSKHKAALQKRQDKGEHWWELRSCAYWDKFDQPKIMYQEIQFHPCYMVDKGGRLANNKVFFLPTADAYLVGVLNSPLLWWYAWRYLPHMKDEALSPVAFKMETLPIARPTDELREEIEPKVQRLIAISTDYGTAQRDVLDWLRTQYGIEKPTQKLQNLAAIDADGMIAEVKKSRGAKKPLSVGDVKQLKEEHGRVIIPLQTLTAEAVGLERQVSDLINAAYGLSAEEVSLLWKTAPPRMPVAPPTHQSSP